jgi:hypothetical protein
MTTEITVSTEQDDSDRRRRLAILKAVGLDRVPPEQRDLALAIAKRYDLDLMLKHLVLVDGRPYVTRDALLHIAHRSGQFDGLEVTEPVLDGDYWRATATVYRKDMSKPFVYPGRYPVKGGNARFAPEMAIKVAEVMALRRAFDVSAPIVEERWDRDLPEPPVAPQTLAQRVAEKRAVMAANHEPTSTPVVDEIVGRYEQKRAQVLPPAAVEDGEPEPDVLDEPMSETESAAIPLMCGAEDKSLDTGECGLPPGHSGPHRNAGGVWPNK